MLGSGSKAGSVVGWDLLWNAEVDSDPGCGSYCSACSSPHSFLQATKEEWPVSWVRGRLGQLSHLIGHSTQCVGINLYGRFYLRRITGCDLKWLIHLTAVIMEIFGVCIPISPHLAPGIDIVVWVYSFGDWGTESFVASVGLHSMDMTRLGFGPFP